jgi:hypothetical protein
MDDRLDDLTRSVAALEQEVKEGPVDAALIGRITTTRFAITEVRVSAQSGAELDACNALLRRLKGVYAP